MEFSIDNALIKMPDGTLMKQNKGIPMGGPMSPGMTIATFVHGWKRNGYELSRSRYSAVLRR